MTTKSTNANKLKKTKSTLKKSAANTSSNPDAIPPLNTHLNWNINLVAPDPGQPRKLFDPQSLEQLQNSIQSTQFVEPYKFLK
jgi:hypothetical protein